MKTLILAAILMFTLNAQAGLKAGVGIENQESIQQSTGSCNSVYINGVLQSKNCSGYVEKKRANTLKVSLGYDLDLTDKYGLETSIGVNSLSNGSIELNGTYKMNDKITAKAGLNTSKDLNNAVISNTKAGLGFQVGANYNLTPKLDLVGSIGSKSQSYEIKDVPGTQNQTSISANVGIAFKF